MKSNLKKAVKDSAAWSIKKYFDSFAVLNTLFYVSEHWAFHFISQYKN